VLITFATGAAVLVAVIGIVWALNRNGAPLPRAARQAASNGSAASGATAATPVAAPRSGSDRAAASEPAPPGGPVAGDVHATVTLAPGSCRFDPDAGELRASGTIRNTGGDGIVEVDVSFNDATGSVDSASAVEPVGPGETVQWEASTIAIDPPSGTLSCRVTQG
jgi:hypothetical protein